MSQEGLERTIESYSHLRAEHQPKRVGPSKVHKYLGGGRGNKLLVPIMFVYIILCFCASSITFYSVQNIVFSEVILKNVALLDVKDMGN